MRRNKPILLLLSLITVVTVAFSGCANVESTNKNSASTDASNPTAAAGKIPITTSSEDARKEFLQGRDLNEKLLVQDSIAHYDKAISLDANFAYAELNRAGVSPTGKEFFDHLKKAVSLADKASNGEKLLILGTEAGANGNAAKQKEYSRSTGRRRILMMSARTLLSVVTTSGSRIFRRPLRTTRRRPSWSRSSLRRSTCSAMRTGRMVITRTRKTHSRNTSS
jgi:hypothetical protein